MTSKSAGTALMVNPIIATMEEVIRAERRRLAALDAGDYSQLRYCKGPGYIADCIRSGYQQTIATAEQVIDRLLKPEDLA